MGYAWKLRCVRSYPSREFLRPAQADKPLNYDERMVCDLIPQAY